MKGKIGKVQKRFQMMKRHPLTRKKPWAALRRYIYFNGKMKISKRYRHRWIHDLQLDVQKGDAGIVGNIYYGLYEFPESMFLLHFLRAEDHFLDVGANLGHFSLLAAGIAKCGTTTIEPVPATFQKLQRQIAINKLEGTIRSLRCGVGSENGSLYFSTDRTVMNRVVNENYPKAVKVEVITLDSLDTDLPIRLLKIDVEGYEYQALQGAKELLQRPTLNAVIMELNDSGKAFGIEDQVLVDLLASYGFAAYSYEPFTRSLQALENYNRSQFNTIFIRDVAAVETRLRTATPITIFNQPI
jgi:FkbM family methyltransferase